jgi:hypothetical protein
LIGGPAAQTSNGQAGATWVVYGQPDSLATIDLANLRPSQGYKVEGVQAGDNVRPASRVSRRPTVRPAAG